MPQTKIIHEDETCLVVHQPGRSAFTLITFASIGHRPKGDWFWAQAASNRLSLDTIGIVPKSDHRYPYGAVAKLVPAINAHAQAMRIGYGFSMGAYGALKHGRLLGLTHVLALSPVNYALSSADIAKLVWDPGFCPERSQGPLISCREVAPVSVQVLDPFFPLDSEQGALFAAAGGIQTIRTPFMDHFTIGLLTGGTTLKSTLNLLLDQDFAGISALLNSNRRKAPERASNLARASLARGKRMRAEKLWQKAQEAGVKPNAVEEARVSGLVKYGRRHLAACPETEIQDTEAFIGQISHEAAGSLRLQRELAHWCEVYGARKAALCPLRRAVDIAPDDLDRWLALGRGLDSAGKTKEALEMLEKARSVCGDRREISALIRRIRQAKRQSLSPFAESRGHFLAQRLRRAAGALGKASFLKYLDRFSRK